MLHETVRGVGGHFPRDVIDVPGTRDGTGRGSGRAVGRAARNGVRNAVRTGIGARNAEPDMYRIHGCPWWHGAARETDPRKAANCHGSTRPPAGQIQPARPASTPASKRLRAPSRPVRSAIIRRTVRSETPS